MTKPKQNVSDLALFLARQVRARRERAGITQAELASRSGVTVETVARLERVLRGRASANANPSLDTLEGIASALGCHPADLIDGRNAHAKADPVVAMVRSAKPETKRRIGLVAQALIRDERQQRRAG